MSTWRSATRPDSFRNFGPIPTLRQQLQGGLADAPAGGQLFLIEVYDVHLGLRPNELAGVHEGAVRPTSQAILLRI